MGRRKMVRCAALFLLISAAAARGSNELEAWMMNASAEVDQRYGSGRYFLLEVDACPADPFVAGTPACSYQRHINDTSEIRFMRLVYHWNITSKAPPPPGTTTVLAYLDINSGRLNTSTPPGPAARQSE